MNGCWGSLVGRNLTGETLYSLLNYPLAVLKAVGQAETGAVVDTVPYWDAEPTDLPTSMVHGTHCDADSRAVAREEEVFGVVAGIGACVEAGAGADRENMVIG